ncbi:MAG: thiamine-phosphate kinase [Candidatus Methanomethylophilus sp.]|nr:thiamine-phosphate kinase [Methanomethylophilus sp.]MDD3233390.1 thiamine-phosphate kinase [Methanomethylophilus sp.]MDD4221951.1 thiamine-phosphate kinase [Methanomethylophilus sp.]MDD4668770.1 thiamine-phosphate kinase [Methanomethylophilus sp.]
MATLKEVGERQLIRNMLDIFRPRSRDTEIGPGDDAAVVGGIIDGRVVVTTDTVTFERHKPRGMTWEQFGWTAAAVNFSDLASMGARPLGFLAAMALPAELDESALYDIASGIDQCCEFCHTEVIGGDTKPGTGLISGTALGTMDGRPPLTRSAAQPGDIVAVTGSIGNAAAGFAAIQYGLRDEDSVFSLMVPVPRTEEGVKLSKSGAVHSCMDLSDGLANAALTVCRRSHVGMELEWEFIPVGAGVEPAAAQTGQDPKDLALRWGGDYELLFTFDRGQIQKLYDAKVEFSIIGTVTNDQRPFLNDGGVRTEMKDGIY